MNKIRNILSIFGLFCSIAYANAPSKSELIFKRDLLLFEKLIKSLNVADSSATEPLKWDQRTFLCDLDDDGEVDVTILFSQSTSPRQIFIHGYLDRQGRQLFLSVIEPQAVSVRSATFIRTKDGKWVSDESDQNYDAWVMALGSLVNSVGGPEKYLKLQTEFLHKLLEYYKDQLK